MVRQLFEQMQDVLVSGAKHLFSADPTLDLAHVWIERLFVARKSSLFLFAQPLEIARRMASQRTHQPEPMTTIGVIRV